MRCWAVWRGEDSVVTIKWCDMINMFDNMITWSLVTVSLHTWQLNIVDTDQHSHEQETILPHLRHAVTITTSTSPSSGPNKDDLSTISPHPASSVSSGNNVSNCKFWVHLTIIIQLLSHIIGINWSVNIFSSEEGNYLWRHKPYTLHYSNGYNLLRYCNLLDIVVISVVKISPVSSLSSLVPILQSRDPSSTAATLQTWSHVSCLSSVAHCSQVLSSPGSGAPVISAAASQFHISTLSTSCL